MLIHEGFSNTPPAVPEVLLIVFENQNSDGASPQMVPSKQTYIFPVTKNHACTKTPSLNGQISICQAQYWIQPESIKTYHSFLKPISSHANIRQRCTRINLILRFFSERNSNGVTKPVLLKTQVVSCFR